MAENKREKILEIKGLKKYFPLKNGKVVKAVDNVSLELHKGCLLYISPSPRDSTSSRMPSSA